MHDKRGRPLHFSVFSHSEQVRCGQLTSRTSGDSAPPPARHLRLSFALLIWTVDSHQGIIGILRQTFTPKVRYEMLNSRIPAGLVHCLKEVGETGIGYQVVSVQLRDGRTFDQVVTSEYCIIEVRGYKEIPFAAEDIASLSVNHRVLEFQKCFGDARQSQGGVCLGPQPNRGFSSTPAVTFSFPASYYIQSHDGRPTSGKKPSPPGAEERLLVEAAQADPSKFDALYELHFERIYFFIVSRVHDRAIAEDLTSEVFHEALANLSTYEWRGTPFSAWLFRIASNAIADQYKRSNREQQADDNTLTRLRPPLRILPQKSWSSSTATPFSLALSKSFPKFSAASSANALSKSAASKKSPNA